MDTGGEQAWHNNTSGNQDLTGRFGVTAISPPEGVTGVFGNSVPMVTYANAAGGIDTNKTTLYGTTQFANGDTFTITVTYNSTNNAVKMYANGSLEIDEIMSVPMQIEGISVGLGASFDRLEIYKGIVADVT
jgi:hypothetical protein